MSGALGGGKVELSLEEMISTLAHSSLPSIVIEGSDDVIVYRRLEIIYSEFCVSVFPVGGRGSVISIYDSLNNLDCFEKLIFVVDMDMWILDGIPNEYRNSKIITTDGYSVENDLIRDGNFLNLLSADEAQKFDEELKMFLYWYAIALQRIITGVPETIKIHPNNLFANYDDLVRLHEQEIFPDLLHATIAMEPLKLVRGKSLLQLLMRQLSYSSRTVRHHHKSLMEMAACSPGDLITSIFEKVGAELSS